MKLLEVIGFWDKLLQRLEAFDFEGEKLKKFADETSQGDFWVSLSFCRDLLRIMGVWPMFGRWTLENSPKSTEGGVKSSHF